MKLFFTLCFSMFLLQQSHAQFSDSVHYFTSFASTGINNRTNDGTSYVLTNAASFKINKQNFIFNSNANWIYGLQQQTLTNNDVTAAVDFNWYKGGNKRFYYWGLANYDASYSLNINHRSQTGAGVAYSVLDEDNAYLNLSNGILFEYVDLVLPDSIRDVYSTFRNSFRLQFRFKIGELVTFDGGSFLQNSLQYKNDFIVRSNTNLSFKLKKWLSLTAATTYNHISRTRRENLLFTFGFRIENYFRSVRSLVDLGD
ncbi:DUF481 domain-containing protein [Aridibaculum aurantiacum]|uniref:DUF481 domain-containing protein n=1 Tax=Aridibaculum aurantiacum TaxID=2810307 RepID=UPI001A979C0A|nr:DUF481 domain-containing protein [Aridibaculum aurantiacum]